ncbi:MAG TPA: excinuclease ABC subunit UvrB, partial [Planctomycetes bacterium]|nr:excinuclease ABC subunit UvrB [Planctomycetota bacterium]
VTGSMEQAISEMERRRAKQLAYNEEHGITPKTIISRIKELIGTEEEESVQEVFSMVAEEKELFGNKRELQKHLESLRERMGEAARALEFEEAARLRDELFRLEEMDLKLR